MRCISPLRLLVLCGGFLMLFGCTWQPVAPSSTPDASLSVDYGTPAPCGAFNESMPQSVLQRLNADRRAAGVPELKMDYGSMMQAAQTRALELTVHFAHERPNGDPWNTVFSQHAVYSHHIGENLAAGQSSPETVYKSWWDSTQGHKENMLNENYTHVSIACLYVNNKYFWVQLFRSE